MENDAAYAAWFESLMKESVSLFTITSMCVHSFIERGKIGRSIIMILVIIMMIIILMVIILDVSDNS